MKEHSFEVEAHEAGARIDRWLVNKLGISRKQVKDLLDNGKVLVNRRRVLIAGWELEAHDHVMVRIPERGPQRYEIEQAPVEVKARHVNRRPSPPERKTGERKSALRNIGKPTLLYREEQSLARKVRDEAGRGGSKKRGDRAPHDEGRRLKIYHEDKHLVVVEKPAGLLSVAQKGSDAPDLVSRVRAYLKRRHPGFQHSYVQPLHRLDSETSGIMVLATSKQGEKLSQQFRSHTIRRGYTAAVYGKIEKEQGLIEAPLEKGRFGHGRKSRIAKRGSGKTAKTSFRVQERYQSASLLDVTVETGRTHQIRVHLASVGHPLIGDRVYDEQRDDRIDFPRHALHAHRLGFKHPVTGKRHTFHSPLPRDMKDLVDSLRTG